MSYYKIQGGHPLQGQLAIHGAKNSVLPILAATLLAPGESVIHNCPDLSDVTATLDILRLLGCRVGREQDTVWVDTSQLTHAQIPEHLMREMRSSVIFLGAMLARLGEAEMSYPGGCELGPRPIDLHLSALRALGAEILEVQGGLSCHKCGRGLHGQEICLSLPSVGATENAMLAACGCQGLTTIVGAAREPEIVDLQNFLQSMGAKVSGAGSSVISIQGGVPLHPAQYRVMGDRIAAATYLCATAATSGEVEITGISPDTLTVLLSCLTQGGCDIHIGQDSICLKHSGPLKGISAVRTAPYPGFPTDAQAILMAALAGGVGTTLFVENMFDSRYHHVDELRRMGADIQVVGRVAVVTGAGRLRGANLRSTDLRGGAALVVAALGAEGVSWISELHHIHRGYQNFSENLRALGAEIQQLP